MKWATKWQQISNKKDPILLESISQECSYINGFEYGGGGIRTHGALADTLVFKASLFLVIPIDLMVLDETKRPIVDHFGRFG